MNYRTHYEKELQENNQLRSKNNELRRDVAELNKVVEELELQVKGTYLPILGVVNTNDEEFSTGTIHT